MNKKASRSGIIPRGERIVDEIVKHTLSRHLPFCSGSLGEHIEARSTQLEQLFLPAPGILADDFVEDADTLTRKAVESLDTLRGILMSQLKELPLVVESVLAASPELRYTSLIPPTQHPLLLSGKDAARKYSGKQISLVVNPLAITVQLQAGGKWPSDADAIRQIKTALYLKLSELLGSQFQVRFFHYLFCYSQCFKSISSLFIFCRFKLFHTWHH
jgi:hypothetical protein